MVLWVPMPYASMYAKRINKQKWAQTEKGKAVSKAASEKRQQKIQTERDRLRAERRLKYEQLGGVWIDELYDCIDGKRRRELLVLLKSEIGCPCGNKDGRVIKFRKLKGGYVGDKVNGYGGYRLMLAILGAPLECSNCHRIRRTSKKSLRIELDNIKAAKGCEHCGLKDGRCLEFHHEDPDTKVDNVSFMVRVGLKRALEEANKCRVLCSNCHLIEHQEQAGRYTSPIVQAIEIRSKRREK